MQEIASRVETGARFCRKCDATRPDPNAERLCLIREFLRVRRTGIGRCKLAPMPPALSLLTNVLVVVVSTYAVLLAGIFLVMCLPPPRFGRVMRHVPMPMIGLLPFPPMWNVARAGRTRVGAPAPDFTLPMLDGSRHVSLSSFRGAQPVVLVFGSYT